MSKQSLQNLKHPISSGGLRLRQDLGNFWFETHIQHAISLEVSPENPKGINQVGYTPQDYEFAPENGAGSQKERKTCSNHQFSGVNSLLVSGRVDHEILRQVWFATKFQEANLVECSKFFLISWLLSACN